MPLHGSDDSDATELKALAVVAAIKRFIVRNIVDASAIRDIQDSSALDSAHAPPFVSCLCEKKLKHKALCMRTLAA